MTMRALIGGKGPEWALEELELPEQLGAIRVQVMAADLDRADLNALDSTHMAAGRTEGTFAGGREVAGIVPRSSMLAPHLPVGTRVMGVTADAFADYVLCHPRMLVPIPDHLGFEEAATLPVGLITERDALVAQAGFTEGRETDITLDHVGGALFAQLPAATAIVGRTVSIGRLAGPAAELNLDTVAFRRLKLIDATFSIRTRAELGDVLQALIPDVLAALQDGRITPHLDSVHTPAQAKAAAHRLRTNQTEHHPGTVIEISDLGGSQKFIFGIIKLAAANWDGGNPIQEINAVLIDDPAAQASMLQALG